MNAKKVDIPQDKLEAYNDLIGGIPEIERKGVTNPCSSPPEKFHITWRGDIFRDAPQQTAAASFGTMGITYRAQKSNLEG